MNTLEIILVIILIWGVIKLTLFYSLNRKFAIKWLNFIFRKKGVEKIYMLLELVLLIALMFFLITRGFDAISSITAFFIGLLVMGLYLLPYPKEMKALGKAIIEHPERAWLSTLIMIVLMIWALYVLISPLI